MGATRFPNGLSVSKFNGGIGQKDVVEKVKVIRIDYSDGTTETSTGWTLPDLAIVEDIFIRVVTAEATGATKTIDIGPLSTETGGDANGYVDGVSVAAIATVHAGLTVSETTGTNEKYISVVTSTFGILLGQLDSELGTDVLGNTGYVSLLPVKYVNSNGNTISWTPGSNDFAELVADIIILYKELA